MDRLEVNTNTCAAPINHNSGEASFSASTAPSSDGLAVAPEKQNPVKHGTKFTNGDFVGCVLSAVLS